MAQRLSREERMAMRTAQIKPTAGDNIIKHVIKADNKQSEEAERKILEEKEVQKEEEQPKASLNTSFEENVNSTIIVEERNNEERQQNVQKERISDDYVSYEPQPRKGKSLLLKKQKELKSERINFIVTKKAKNNLQKCAKDFGYRSTNDFINELLENLEEYLY